MGEVEAQPVGRDERALLRHMIAEHLAQRLVQKMRRRMIGAHLPAPLVIDVELEREAGRELAFLDDALMNDEIAELLACVLDAEAHAAGAHHADVADLSAQFAIEGRLIEDQRPARALP